MNLIALADRLHKTIGEIEEIPLSELYEWMAYFKVMEDGRPKN
jgi:hypothetical protein